MQGGNANLWDPKWCPVLACAPPDSTNHLQHFQRGGQLFLRRANAAKSRDFASFKPPPRVLPPSPQDLVRDLPFQYWYSYADLPLDVPKRRPKSDPALVATTMKNWDPFKLVRLGGGPGAEIAEASLLKESKKNAAALELELEVKQAKEKGEEEGDGPLSEKELKKLVESCHGIGRQINIGWQGWTENYIALVHSYWRRSKVCKIKCKGVPTLDMDLMCSTLEEQTGGKVIHRHGGTLYLFHGHQYSYQRDAQQPPIKRRPFIQWPPKRLPVPPNLTKEEVLALRARGRELAALCKLGKNGVYLTLLNDVKKAFETEDLVRINCQGFHARNLKALGAKLQDLIPCKLISYEFEHILMWRSKDENSSNTDVEKIRPEDSCK